MMQMNASAVTKLTQFPNRLLVIHGNTLQYLYFRIIFNIIQRSKTLFTQIDVRKPGYEELMEKEKLFAGENTINSEKYLMKYLKMY